MTNTTNPHDADGSPLIDGHDPEGPLPPVQPPGAGFIMQLFFVPMVIVTIIVSVWLAFSWLAHVGSRPEELVKDFERLNEGTWQKALTLANLLRDPGNDELRNNGQLAQRLAVVLETQLEQGRMDPEHVSYRMYLCRALGEFNVADGIPTLLSAADMERSPEEMVVRRAALQALGRLVGSIGHEPLEADPNAFDVLSQAAMDHGEGDLEQRGQLRSAAAFVMGLLHADAYHDRLELMLSDGFAYARYNAASGLARHGDPRALPRLLEMLDPANQTLQGDDRERAGEHQWNQRHVLTNALRATRQLVELNPEVEVQELQSAVQTILDGEPNGQLQLEAQDTMRVIRERDVHK